jgi:hypothetical protein
MEETYRWMERGRKEIERKEKTKSDKETRWQFKTGTQRWKERGKKEIEREKLKQKVKMKKVA